MKRILTVLALCALVAAPAMAAQQNISTVSSVTASREALRTALNTRLTDIDENFDELYTAIGSRPWVVQATAPADTTLLWFDTDQSPGEVVLKVYAGGVWVAHTIGAGGGDYTLPAATASALGGVIDGAGVTIAGDGTLSADLQAVGDCTAAPCLDGSADGGNLIKLWAGTGSYWTALQGGAPSANRSWRLPILAPPSAGETNVMTMDEYGQMAFLDKPSTSGYVLSSTDAGVLSWAAPATAGGDDLGDATYSTVVGLWTTCSGYLKSDGTCDTPSGSFSYPGAGVPQSTGSAWGTSLTVGTGANNLVQLNASSQLPAVSAALLTNFPTLNQNTTGSAATLTTARTIGGVSFNGSANINLPGVNTTGNQNTTGTAAGLTAQYINWSASSGGSSIANKPTIPTASDTAYDATSWNGNTDVPTKNAVRDKIETISGGTDDQTAAEVNITDTGAYFTGTNVETALQEVGSDLAAMPNLAAGTGIMITVDGGGAGIDTIGVTANTYQPLDSDLTAIAALTTTATGLSILDDTTTGAMLTTLGVTANGQSLITAANYAAMKTLLDTDDIQTLTGIAAGTANLGTFTGTTIADSSTIKAGMQALETAVEGKQAADADLGDLADGSLTGSKVSAASDTAVGVSELAIASEINTGTDAARAITPDALAGSNLGSKEIGWVIVKSDTVTAVADGKDAIAIPSSMNGMNLVDVTCSVSDLNSAASGTTTVVLRRVRGATAADMTSTGVTIGYNEYTASDETVDTANDDVQTGDKIFADVNAVTTAVHKGLYCTAVFRLP